MCSYCPQSDLLKTYTDQKKIMSLDEFKYFLTRIPTDIQIHFSGFSESMLNDESIDMMIHAASQGYEVVLYSTLVGFDAVKGMKLRNAGIIFEQTRMHAYDGIGFNQLEFEGKSEIFKSLVTSRDHMIVKIDNPTSRAGHLKDVERKYGSIACCGDRTRNNVLLPNGDVFLCCCDWSLKHKIGNLYESTYNSPELNSARGKITGLMNMNDSDILCRTCEDSYPCGDIKIDVHVCTHNEEMMIPHFIKHYKQYTNRIFVHDQHSTDKTVEIATENGCIVSTWGGDQIDDELLLKEKHEAYKSSTDCDFVFIVDCDELVTHDDLIGKLRKCKVAGIKVPMTIGYNMSYDNFDYIKNSMSDVTDATPSDTKFCIIKSNETLEYGVGCHWLKSPFQEQYQDSDPILFLHYKWLNYEYMYTRYRYFQSRLCQQNIEKGWGLHYAFDDSRIESEFQYLRANNIKLSPIC